MSSLVPLVRDNFTTLARIARGNGQWIGQGSAELLAVTDGGVSDVVLVKSCLNI